MKSTSKKKKRGVRAKTKPGISHVKYTKAPWRIILTTAEDGGYVSAMIEGYSGQPIANVTGAGAANIPNADLIVLAPEFAGALLVALDYLRHPDVQAIPFALPSLSVADSIHSLLTKAGIDVRC